MSNKRPANRVLGFESLERRELMAANLTAGISAGISLTTTNPTNLSPGAISVQPTPFRVSGLVEGRTLKVEGTDQVDNILVRQLAQTLWIEGARIWHNGSALTSINAALIDKVEVRGYKGGDTIDLSSLWIDTEVWAGEGVDIVRGGNRNDAIHGGANDDQLRGNDGDDRLWGDGGADRLWGGRHNDHLFGGESLNDRLWGDEENDWLEAGSWLEFADGGTGQDWNAHTWAINGATVTDIRQGFTKTCAFLSSLAACSRFQDLAANISYEGDFTYAVWLYDDEMGGWFQERVHFDGSMRIALGEQFDPISVAEGEFWTIVYQRAYLQHYEGINDSNWILTALFDGESGRRPIRTITGIDAAYFDPDTITPEDLQAKAAIGPVTVGDGIHVYMVYELFQDENGNWFVTLFNPWGYDETHVDALIAEREPDSFINHNEGFINVKWAVFKSVFDGGCAG